MAQRSQMNAKEKLGREIDLTNASKDELIEHLCKIIEYEVEKGEDADYDLVRECSDWLDELTEDEVTFTPEELERKLAQLKAGSESKKPVKICKKAKLKTFVRVALIAAVIFAISLVSLSAVAVNKGYGSAWEYISANVEKIFGLNQGEAINGDGITVIKNTGTVRYDNMDELIKSEKLNILYPHMMPDNIQITQLRYINTGDDRHTLCLLFSDSTYSFDISNYYSTDITSISGFEKGFVNDMEYYISKKENDQYFAIIQYNGYEYSIRSISYNNLLTIINSMKG